MLRKLPAEILIIVGAFILFVPFLGATHLFDWDEINFAEASREMLVTHNYPIPQIAFEPFWEKPPLFFWLQVVCMKIFGVNEFASHLPNAVCGGAYNPFALPFCKEGHKRKLRPNVGAHLCWLIITATLFQVRHC